MVEILGCNFVFGVIVAAALTPRVTAAISSVPVRSSSF
jgi:hypothetical protein